MPRGDDDEKIEIEKEKLEVSLRANAQRSLTSIINEMGPYSKVNFYIWKKRLVDKLHLIDWPTWPLIDDFSDDAKNDQIPADKDISSKDRIHLNYLYQALTSLIESDKALAAKAAVRVTRGDVRELYKVIYQHSYRPTLRGQRELQTDYLNATMRNTGTNLVEYMVLVQNRASRYAAATGVEVPDDQIRDVILGGLLPEFDTQKDLIDDWEDARLEREGLAGVMTSLEDFAVSKKILNLTVAGEPTEHRTYYVKEDCRRFLSFATGGRGCPDGSNCKYGHPPNRGGGLAPEAQNGPRQTTQPTFSTQKKLKSVLKKTPANSPCANCGQLGHWKRECPNAETKTHANKDPPKAHNVRWPDTPSWRMLEEPEQNNRTSNLTFTAFVDDEYSVDKQISVAAALSVLFWALMSTIFWAPKTLVSSLLSTPRPILLALVVGLLTAWASIGSDGAQVNPKVYYNTAGKWNPEKEWCSDSGTNRFVTNDVGDFIPGSIKRQSNVVSVGNGKAVSPMVGDVLIKSLDYGTIIRCTDVLLLPNCGAKLMPNSPFVRRGCEVRMYDRDKITMTGPSGGPLFEGIERQGLYYFNCTTVHVDSLPPEQGDMSSDDRTYFGLRVGPLREGAADFGRRLLETHWAFGHIHFNTLRKLLGLKPGDNPECAACAMAMSRQRALAKTKPEHARSTRPNHRLHADLGYIEGNNGCFQLFVDDYTRESFIDILTSKADCLTSFKKLHQRLNKELAPYNLSIVKTDNEPVYLSKGWDDYCSANNIDREYSPRYRHDGNGVVERSMGTIGGCFRAMMIHGNAPSSDAPHALNFANVVRNNTPTKANKGWTPREKSVGKKLPVNRKLLEAPIFCLCFAHVYPDERHKHDNRGIPSVYLGYDDINNTFLIKEWTSGKKYWTADITFHPNRFPYRSNPTRMSDWLHQYDELAPYTTVPIKDVPQIPLATPGKASDIIPAESSTRKSTRDRVPSRKALENIANNFTSADEVVAHYVHNFGNTNPTWDEAMLSQFADDWIAAKLTEINSFRERGVFTLVRRSEAKGKKIFKSREVLKLKLNPPDLEHPMGSIDKFRYRMTIAAFTRMLKQGIDYKEKYASTVQWNAIKILIAIAVKEDFDIALFDIATFFLYGELEEGEEIFMEQPPGWVTSDYPAEDWIWKLNKSMYGLPNAAHCAQRKLRANVTADDKYHLTKSDDCVFVSREANPTKSNYSASGAHVDDIVTIGRDEGLRELYNTLKKDFDIKMTRNPSVILGVQIQRDRNKRWAKLHQEARTEEILAKYNMQDCKPADTPMDPGTAKALMMLPTDHVDPVVLKKYQSYVGDLIYLMKTRPDLHFTVNLLSRFLQNATAQHLKLATNRPLRYLRKTTDHGIVIYPGSDEWVLSGNSDADLAGDLTTARSTLGHFLKLGQYGTIATKCGLERKICTSTGQAETYAMQGLIKECVWTRTLLAELGYPMSDPTPLFTDNAGVVKQSTKAINHSMVKHYRIAQAWIRNKVSDGTCNVGSVGTEKNGADMLTKANTPTLFCSHHHEIMGPQEPPVA